MTALAVALWLLSGVEGGGAEEPPSVPWDGISTTLHRDETAQVRLAIPTTGYLLESHHFDRDLPAGMVKDSLTVFVGGEARLVLEIFHNAEGLALPRFFDAHLSFLQDPAIARTEGLAGKARVPAILLDQPRTGQAFAQRIAFFALGGRVFKLACVDRDDPATALLFERALQTLEEAP